MGQVGTNYGRGLEYLESLGVAEVWTLERHPGSGSGEDGSKGRLREKSVVPVGVCCKPKAGWSKRIEGGWMCEKE